MSDETLPNSEASETPVTPEISEAPVVTESSAPQVIDQGVQEVPTPPTPPAPPAPPAPKVVKAVKAVKAAPVETQESEASDFITKIEQLKATGTQSQKILIASLEKYIVEMAPGRPVDIHVGARHQYNLWKAITFVTETAPAEEFKKLWNIVLGFFDEYKSKAFHDRYVFRFAEYWIWADHELNGLHRILNVIKLTANPKERAHGLRQVDLDRSLADGFSDTARQKLISFYRA